MSESQLKDQVLAEFPDFSTEDALLKECMAVCKNYGISPEDLRFKWEAQNFRPSTTRSAISSYTLESLLTLRSTIQSERTARVPVARPTPQIVRRGTGRMLMNRAPVVKTEAVEASFAGPSRVRFEGDADTPEAKKQRAYRYMHMKLSERGDALDATIDEFAERVRDHFDISELGDPSASTSDEITVVGRIVHDDELVEDTSKLADNAVALQCSHALGYGKRVPLRFDWDLKIRGGAQGSGSASLFPGAFACLRGKNGGGGYFQVSEILLLPCPPPTDDPVKLENPFSVLIASGPYTSDQDLGFRPWRGPMLKKIQETKPDVVILLGPFIDAMHPLIQSGDSDSTPLNLFRTRFADPLRAYLDSVPGSMAVVVPSVRDLISSHAVYPQCELDAGTARNDTRIHLVSNPAWFSLDGVSFAATSEDVLFHIKKGEFVKRGGEVDSVPPILPEDLGTDSMGNLSRQILQQRSFYPVFPVPQELSEEITLDITHADGLKLRPWNEGPEQSPDVLIVPSRLRQFAKPVHGTMALNPSFVSKGTFAVLDISPSPEGRPRLDPRLEKLS
ncbi:unnamed protein product [Mycena citricolor]|uniref:DNA polymerase alpha subunit B n=1 Tax=Mycena citricolor TaxID=2018698 RepID=A0AAD2HY92_9AGAR|nr:unnamed protein product [Mycena citricolor]